MNISEYIDSTTTPVFQGTLTIDVLFLECCIIPAFNDCKILNLIDLSNPWEKAINRDWFIKDEDDEYFYYQLGINSSEIKWTHKESGYSTILKEEYEGDAARYLKDMDMKSKTSCESEIIPVLRFLMAFNNPKSIINDINYDDVQRFCIRNYFDQTEIIISKNDVLNYDYESQPDLIESKSEEPLVELKKLRPETETIENLLPYIGRMVRKKSNNKFKSELRYGTVSGITINKYSNRAGFTFIQDEMVVECFRCVLLDKAEIEELVYVAASTTLYPDEY